VRRGRAEKGRRRVHPLHQRTPEEA
jgi:hypothetical protein